MVDSAGCIFLSINDPLHLFLALSKVLLIAVLLLCFYRFFIRSRRRQGALSDRGGDSNIKIELLGNRRFNPSVISLMVRNNGNRDIDLEAPVLIFCRWSTRRKFRILAVEYSNYYPVFLEQGGVSIVKIELEQFYRRAPGLRRSGRMGVEMNEVNGRKFKSGKIRLNWV